MWSLYWCPLASLTSRAIWTRLLTSSLSSRRETWALTVGTERCRAAAISALAWPRPTARATSCSRGLSVAIRCRAWSVRAPASESPATMEMSRRVTVGESMPSPAWTSSIARTISAGGVSLSRKPAAGLQRAQDELVGVEGREDDDGGRVGLRGEQAGGSDSVELRHADVHEDDVGAVEVDRAEHLAAVRGLGDHVEVLGAGEHDPQAGAHERVVVDEQDADHRGRLARRTYAPSGSTPCSSVPPASETRSASPIRPVPVPGGGAAAAT